MAEENRSPTSKPSSTFPQPFEHVSPASTDSDTTPPSAHFGSDGYARMNRPSTPSSFTTFSWSSTMDSRAFREEDGRRFQAANDDYSLPADQQELERLEIQHYAFKAVQGGKNYFAPVDQALPHGGEGKRVLDVGCGTGAWTIEIAQEFPCAEVIGTDLAPVQREEGVPDNVQFIHEDACKGLPFPDDYFDLVHLRVLIAGVRNWKSLVNEMARILRPGGLMLFVEAEGAWVLHGVDEDEAKRRAPGLCKFADYLAAAMTERGYDIVAANRTIAKSINENSRMGPITQIESMLPLWEWSDDPNLKRGGEIMYHDACEIPDTVRHLIMDALGVPSGLYSDLKKGWMEDLRRPGATAKVPIWHTYAWKK